MSSIAGALISDPTSFTILELTGPRNNLVLQGRALPYRPLSFDGGMRAEVTWYPGNPVGTVQMLGAEEMPTTINGMWKDRFIATEAFGLVGGQGVAEFNGQRILNVRDLVEVVDAFRLRGQLIEVGWDQFVRQGILKRFRQTWLRREDVEWEMEFDWISRGEPITPVAFGPSFTLQDVFNNLNDALDTLKDAAEAPFAVVSAVQSAINQSLQIIERAVSAVKDLADQAVSAVLAPLEAAKMTLASVQTIKEEAQTIRDTLQTLPARAMRQVADVRALAQAAFTNTTEGAEADTTVSAGGTSGASSSDAASSLTAGFTQLVESEAAAQGVGGVTQEQAVEAEKWKRDTSAAARGLQSIAALREQEIQAQTTKIADVQPYIAIGGQDLRDVSTIFYGTSEEWKRLLTYNNLSTSLLSAGQIVLVPPLGAEERVT